MANHSKQHSASHTKTTIKTRSAEPKNAITLLQSDHTKVKGMFKTYEHLVTRGKESDKVDIALQICQELKVHMRVEEEIFYPAAYAAFGEPDLIDEAVVEHATVKDLIRQIESMVGSDALYDARVMVLGEYVIHHIDEEEKDMFPKARKCGMDLEGLGESIDYRRDELMAPMATH